MSLPQSQTSGRFSWHWMAVALLLGVGALVRFHDIGGPSLWMDEIWSIEIASGRDHAHDQLPTGILMTEQRDLTSLAGSPPWWRVWSARSDYTYPPLYPLLLRWWMDLFGNGAAAVRSLSAVFCVAAIAAFFDVCRLLHGARLALLGAAMMTLAVAQIDIAQEARCYAMMLFLALACAGAMVRIEARGATKRRLLALAGFLAAMLLTHYLSIGLAVALLVYALIRLRGLDRRGVILALAGGAALALAVWAPSLYWQVRHLPGGTPLFLREADPARHASRTLRRVLGLPGEFLCGEAAAERMFRGQTPGDQILTVFLLLIAVLTLLVPFLRLRRRHDLWLWCLWILGNVGLLTLADAARGTTMAGYLRYTILASPAVYALIATFDWPRRPVLRHALGLAVLAAVALVSADRLAHPAPAKEDWRAAAADLQASAGSDEPIVFFNADPWVAPGMWYMCLHYYWPRCENPWLLLRRPPEGKLLEQLQSRSSMWLVGVDAQTAGPIVFPGWQVQRVFRPTEAVCICRMIRIAQP